jgi:DNA-directed RNA polymerase subunit RPC12/RpoP
LIQSGGARSAEQRRIDDELIRDADQVNDRFRRRLGYEPRPGGLASLQGPSKKKNPEGRISCPKCDKTFPKHYYAQKHWEAVHCKESEKRDTHECPTCKKRFMSAFQLNRHKIQMHSTEFPCATCGKAFGTAQARVQHIADVHSGRKDYQCTHCDKWLYQVQKSSLTNHERYCSDNPAYAGPYPCPHRCGKVFKRPGEATRHGGICQK